MVNNKYMNIYKVTNKTRIDYDTFDSMIVFAKDEQSAREIHPSDFVTHHKNGKWYGTRSHLHKDSPRFEYETENCAYSSWVLFKDIDKLEVELIGNSELTEKEEVIVASFNAG